MDNRERFLAAIKREQPDRVPYFDLGYNEESIINIGKHFTSDIPEKKFLVDYAPEEAIQLLNVLVTFIRELDIDAINSVFFTGRARIPDTDDLLEDRYGVIYKMTEHGEPFPVDGPVKQPDDLKDFRIMKADRLDLLMLDYLRATAPERAVCVTLPGTFRFSWSVMGRMESLLHNYVINPEFCLQLARITTDFVKEIIELSIEAGADVIIMEGDLAFKTNTLMSPDHYRKFLKPFHHEACEIAHKRGIPIIKHSDGNLWPILDDLVEAGFDGIHPIQPQSMEIQDAKKHLRGKACVLGNIDCTYLLPFGEKEEVVDSVKETIKKAAPGGGYILSSSNSIHPGCKSENVIAMFEAAKKYGSYPITIDDVSS